MIFLTSKIANFLQEDSQLKSLFSRLNKTNITLRDVLLHTAGFENKTLGLFLEKAKETEETEDDSLKKLIESRLPIRRFKTGEIYSFSQHGVILGGFILRQIANENFDTLISELFQKFNMTHSSYFNINSSDISDPSECSNRNCTPLDQKLAGFFQILVWLV
jgi:CubicO group peptidase (beta-lactamase class C family)